MSDAEFDANLLELMARSHEPCDDDELKAYIELWDSLRTHPRCRVHGITEGTASLIAQGYVKEIWRSEKPKECGYDITERGYALVRGGAKLGRIERKLDSVVL